MFNHPIVQSELVATLERISWDFRYYVDEMDEHRYALVQSLKRGGSLIPDRPYWMCAEPFASSCKGYAVTEKSKWHEYCSAACVYPDEEAFASQHLSRIARRLVHYPYRPTREKWEHLAASDPDRLFPQSELPGRGMSWAAIKKVEAYRLGDTCPPHTVKCTFIATLRGRGSCLGSVGWYVFRSQLIQANSS